MQRMRENRHRRKRPDAIVLTKGTPMKTSTLSLAALLGLAMAAASPAAASTEEPAQIGESVARAIERRQNAG